MDLTSYDSVTRYITNECLKAYEGDEALTAREITMHLLECPELKMHCPQHHYLIPAAMLTAAYKVQGRPAEVLRDDLTEAMMRAKNVLPGFCGLYGSCGAAVGLGIFSSILTGTSPYSKGTWALTNRIVGEALIRMSEIDGPRCCKRNSFLALQEAEQFAREELEIDLGMTEKIVCEFHSRNPECKKESCPFYQVSP